MTDLYHISEGNDKTACFSFDLPAKTTCPGMTKECGSKCYAFNLMRIYKAVAAKYERNLILADSDKFVAYMIKNIPRRCEFRIHVSGDFYSAEYIKAWGKIIAKRSDVIFYAYTRSWQIPELWSLLLKLHMHNDNFNLNLSVDDETGAPRVLGAGTFRWCYLTGDDKAPDWIRKGDIVFRTNYNGQKRRRKNDVKKGLNPDIRSPLIHKAGKGTVCPMERGREMPKTFSCATCHLCVDKPKVNALV